MYIRTGYVEPSILEDVNVDEIVVDFTTNYIYTKNLNSQLITVGNTKRRLTDFNEFIPQTFNQNTFIQFAYIDGVLHLSTSRLPEVSLVDFEGTNFTTFEEGNYLGISNSNLSNISKPEFKLTELNEWWNNSFNSLIAARNNYAVTVVYTVGYNTGDEFIPDSNYYLRLLPETSTLSGFDDVQQATPLNYYVILPRFPQENVSYRYKIRPFEISYDEEPKLAYSLDCANKVIINETYKLSVSHLNQAVCTVIIDASKTKTYRYVCTEQVNQIYVNINIDTDLRSNILYTSILDISGLEGVIVFEKDVVVENGIQPRHFGNHNIYSILVYRQTDGTVHKQINFRSHNIG